MSQSILDTPAAGADPGAGTPAATPPPAPDPGGAATPPASPPAAGSAPDTPEAGSDDFTQTVAAGGDKAVSIVQNQQRLVSEKAAELQEWKSRLGKMVEDIGGLDRFTEAVRDASVKLGKIETHPEAAKAYTDFFSSGQWPGASPTADPTSDEYDDPNDPIMQRLKAAETENASLRARVSGVETIGVEQRLRSSLDTFFGQTFADSTIGELIQEEEKAEVVGKALGVLKQYQKSADGQDFLRQLNPDAIAEILQSKVSPKMWAEFGTRANQRKLETVRGAGTGPAPTPSSGHEPPAEGESAVDALKRLGREEGWDLENFQIGR